MNSKKQCLMNGRRTMTANISAQVVRCGSQVPEGTVVPKSWLEAGNQECA